MELSAWPAWDGCRGVAGAAGHLHRSSHPGGPRSGGSEGLGSAWGRWGADARPQCGRSELEMTAQQLLQETETLRLLHQHSQRLRDPGTPGSPQRKPLATHTRLMRMKVTSRRPRASPAGRPRGTQDGEVPEPLPPSPPPHPQRRRRLWGPLPSLRGPDCAQSPRRLCSLQCGRDRCSFSGEGRSHSGLSTLRGRGLFWASQ